MCVGLLFPATVTLLNFESNRLMGPNIAGAISGLAPVFAVLLALALLGESIHLLQFLGITAIVVGVMFMYREQRQNLQRWSLWMLSLFASSPKRTLQQVLFFVHVRWVAVS